jgi:hypothetical protein
MGNPSVVRLLSGLAAGSLFAACSGTATSPGFAGSGSDDGGSDAAFPSGSGGASSGSFVGSFGGRSGSGGGTVVASGQVGPVDVTPPCDTGLAVDGDPVAFAKSIGICSSAAQDGWGLVSAVYQNAFGSSAPPAAGQWGLLPSFGRVIKPREGALLGALSSGYARAWDDAAGVDLGPNSDFVAGIPMDGMNYPTGAAPPGFPKAAQGCPQDGLVNDMIDVKLVMKAPPDATGFRFDFDFFSSEWPDFVCSNFNDAFVAYLTTTSSTGSSTGNISFDAKDNPVAVNMSFLNRCTPGAPVGCLRSDGPGSDAPLYTSSCSAGAPELLDTGYDDPSPTQCDPDVVGNVVATQGASTGWLTTTAAVTPGAEFTLELMIWDAGDGQLDSTVLIDHFEWLGGQGQVDTITQPAM